MPRRLSEQGVSWEWNGEVVVVVLFAKSNIGEEAGDQMLGLRE